MYDSSRMNDGQNINFQLPWNTNTATGFGVSLALMAIALLLAPYLQIEKPPVRELSYNTIPIELLNFGDGDGTGASKGNLSEEGAAHKGEEPISDLHDAERAAKTKRSQSSVSSDYTDGTKIRPADRLASDKNSDDDNGASDKNVGSPDGSPSGGGLGRSGGGSGLGKGYGGIEWGGGGNRTVLSKKIPDFPSGAATGGEVKIRFTVLSDGTVSRMIPLQKSGGDPTLEKAAMRALKQWRFNKLSEDKEMVGVITFIFKLS